jgi:hypothetical protein
MAVVLAAIYASGDAKKGAERVLVVMDSLYKGTADSHTLPLAVALHALASARPSAATPFFPELTPHVQLITDLVLSLNGAAGYAALRAVLKAALHGEEVSILTFANLLAHHASKVTGAMREMAITLTSSLRWHQIAAVINRPLLRMDDPCVMRKGMDTIKYAVDCGALGLTDVIDAMLDVRAAVLELVGADKACAMGACSAQLSDAAARERRAHAERIADLLAGGATPAALAFLAKTYGASGRAARAFCWRAFGAPHHQPCGFLRVFFRARRLAHQLQLQPPDCADLGHAAGGAGALERVHRPQGASCDALSACAACSRLLFVLFWLTTPIPRSSSTCRTPPRRARAGGPAWKRRAGVQPARGRHLALRLLGAPAGRDAQTVRRGGRQAALRRRGVQPRVAEVGLGQQ